jgi:hypothetical protein
LKQRNDFGSNEEIRGLDVKNDITRGWAILNGAKSIQSKHIQIGEQWSQSYDFRVYIYNANIVVG